MIINYETLDEPQTKHILATSFVFERVDPKKREDAFKDCLKKVSSFLSKKVSCVNLVLFNIKVIDTKVNRHLGVWNILEKKFKLTLPEGARSECYQEKDGHLLFTCRINVSFNDIDKTIGPLDRHRSSILILGDTNNIDSLQDDFFKYTEHLEGSDTLSWLPLVTQIAKKGFIGVRVFGMFDDLDNGVLVYEPLKLAKYYGDWCSRD